MVQIISQGVNLDAIVQISSCFDICIFKKQGDHKKVYKMENGSISLAPQMRHILASLDSVASAADGIQKEA